jgi:signal transduction histidine kinase
LSMLSHGGLVGEYHTGRIGPRVLAVRKKQKSMSLRPGVEQARLDSYLNDESLFIDLGERAHSAEQEWRMTIGTMLRHDLLNKLTVAQGGLELFDRSGETKFLNIARRNMEACSEVVARISMLEKAPEATSLTPMDVSIIAKSVMDNHKERGIGLVVQGQGRVMADAALHNVLDNLVSNSIKHAAPSQVIIDIEESGKTVMIKIIDDGVGIPKEARDGLFQEGFKFGPNGNTGLGLFIVRRLVQRYGGRIWLDDGVLDRTVFCIELRNVNA